MPPKVKKYIMKDIATLFRRARCTSRPDVVEVEVEAPQQTADTPDLEPQVPEDVAVEEENQEDPVGIVATPSVFATDDMDAENQADAGIEAEENSGQRESLIEEFNSNHIEVDPGLRVPIENFHANIRDEVRLAYVANGPTQPTGHDYPKDRNQRHFCESWYDKNPWLEYSVDKDAIYFFYCFLFRQDPVDEKFGYVAFTKDGFDNWKNAYRALPRHVGDARSIHNKARTSYEDFKNQMSSVKRKVTTYEKDALVKYEIRLETSLGIVSYLALQGEPFRGHDESVSSDNKDNYLEFLDWYKARCPEVKLAFDELCPKNTKMTSPIIQKALAKQCAEGVTRAIKKEMGDGLFSVLIDESRDISVKEQMAVVVRYMNKGEVIERFLCIKHVKKTTSEALKKALVEVLGKHGLLITKLRGQGYDGASNMRGEFNGVQKLFRDENPYAFYMYYFAHRLQLVVVAVSRCCSSIEDFFEYVTLIVNTAGSSCKRKDILLDQHRRNLLAKLESENIFSGRDKNQETSLARPGDTRWGSHYTTLARIESIWDAVIQVLAIVHEDERNPFRTGGLVQIMESFSFVFIMKLMLQILRITNELSLLLQKNDQNIVQVMSLVTDVKSCLINLRNNDWKPLFDYVKIFCNENDIPVPNMDEYVPRFGRSRKKGRNNITQEHFFRVDTFYAAIDAITTELDHRFSDMTSELLHGFACLDPRDSFAKFDLDRIAKLTDIYDADFSYDDRKRIKTELQLFISHMRRHEEFRVCNDLASLAKQMFVLERNTMFPLVYRLIELVLLLSVATTSVERGFSAMKIIKTELRSKMCDDWLNDLMVYYIERALFKGLDLTEIKKEFQKKDRRMSLPPPRHK